MMFNTEFMFQYGSEPARIHDLGVDGGTNYWYCGICGVIFARRIAVTLEAQHCYHRTTCEPCILKGYRLVRYEIPAFLSPLECMLSTAPIELLHLVFKFEILYGDQR